MSGVQFAAHVLNCSGRIPFETRRFRRFRVNRAAWTRFWTSSLPVSNSVQEALR
jgi:hypothetical protein